MNSCHEEGVRERNRAGIEAADPVLRAGSALRKNREHVRREKMRWGTRGIGSFDSRSVP
eukprot:gene26555-biopygen16846